MMKTALRSTQDSLQTASSFPHQTLLNGAGQAFADIEVDIDSVSRSNPPDIGCI